MRVRQLVSVFLVFIALVFLGYIGTMVMSGDVARISKDELKSELENPDYIVIDVRQGGDWKSSGKKVKGAMREDPSDVDSWMSDYPKDKTIVLYCA